MWISSDSVGFVEAALAWEGRGELEGSASVVGTTEIGNRIVGLAVIWWKGFWGTWEGGRKNLGWEMARR